MSNQILKFINMMKIRAVRPFAFLIISARHASSFAKEGFHLRNKHRFGYDLDKFVKNLPELGKFVRDNKYGEPSVDFSDPTAVKTLNHAMLKSCYGIDHWSIPDNYLCPSIPSRADYIHRISDLVSQSIDTTDMNADIVGLDVGVGSSCIYPIIGVTDYKWKFVGTDVDDVALASAQSIISNNEQLRDNVQLRKQHNPNYIFRGVVKKGDKFDFCVANPPFHSSAEAARRGSERKWRNLNKSNTNLNKSKGGQVVPLLNFGGSSGELICEGGEIGFVSRMIKESSDPFVRSRVKVFTSLVSSQDSLDVIYRILDKTAQIDQVYTVEMKHGQKKSRIVAWSYASSTQTTAEEEASLSEEDYTSDEYDSEYDSEMDNR